MAQTAEKRDHAATLLMRMQNYLENEQLCDVIIIAGTDGKRIPAHRLVLAASSEYFAAMFTGSLRETKEEEVTLGDVQGDALQILVQYCYTGSIEIREDNAETLIATACLLQLNDVFTACCDFFANQLHPSNCLGFGFLAERYSCNTLLQEAKSYTYKNFMQVCKNLEFFQLNADQLEKLLSGDDLIVSSEQEVFHSLMSWIQHNPQSREELLPKLLALVRLPLLSPSFILEHVEPVCKTSDCQKLVMKALKWKLLPELRSSTEGIKPRKNGYCLMMVTNGETTFNIETYCPLLNKWTAWKKAPTEFRNFAVTVLNDKLITSGGIYINPGVPVDTVESVDLHITTKTLLAPLNIKRFNHSVVVLEDQLYAVGGLDEHKWTNAVERLDSVEGIWHFVEPMLHIRRVTGVAVLEGLLYVVGGSDNDSDDRNYVECYNPHSTQWTLRASMNKTRQEYGITAGNGYLYAVGGFDGTVVLKSVERYNPRTNTWTLICSLNIARRSIGCTMLGDRLFAVGGFTEKMQNDIKYNNSTIADAYDTETDKWSQVAPLTSLYSSQIYAFSGPYLTT